MLLMQSARSAPLAKRQRGVTLIEILISVLLLSFGILAVVGMQAYAIAAQRNASNRAVASMLANEFAEIVRLNPTAFNAGNYNVSLMPNAAAPDVAATNCAFPNCTTPALLAATDVNLFLRRVRAQLPQGGVELIRPLGTSNQAHLWIVWEEPNVFENTRTAVDGTITSAEENSDNCSATAKALAPLPRCFYAKVEL